jgi:hypothetical protein
MFLSVSNQSTNFVQLNWTGGYPLYQIQRRPFDSSSWVNLGDATTNRISILPMDGPAAMFRVVAIVP